MNVVASARLDENINLDSIARLFPNAKYDDEFGGLVIRICRSERNPRGNEVLILGSGKMVLREAFSEREARNALSGLINQLSRAAIVTSRKLDIKIQNIVASASLGESVDLEKAAYCHCRVMYEPEAFPGLACRMEDPASNILLFASGRLVCTGAKTEPEVRRAVMTFKRLLQGSKSLDDKHTIDVLEVPNAIPFPKVCLVSIGGSPLTLERMMKEGVDCPVKVKRVSFVECYTCANFNRRIRGKVGCAGLSGVW
jgi:transcription initiation factor TFIID TATA-box-binding protein